MAKLSEKLLKILKSKTTLSSEDLDKLTEQEGWGIVYSLSPPKKEKDIEICFTGFDPYEKEKLIDNAKSHNFYVTTSVTKNLAYLCIGEDAGPSKMTKAQEQNVPIITKEQFFELLGTL